MLYYNYDKNTFEYTGTGEASVDPVASKREGTNVYYAPDYATLKQPPSVKEHQTTVFNVLEDKWKIVDDYRGCYVCDEELQITVIQNVGPLPEGLILITEAQAEQIKNDPLWYIVQDGELVENPNYEEEKEAQRRYYLNHLAMTKYDFYKYICQPNGISYKQLIDLVNTNDEIAAAWDLCGHVFRGDSTLCAYIGQFLPSLTPDVLDLVFEQYGKFIED